MIVTGAELGSFARAATRLGRSQSAVSMQLKKLEEQTGKALFRRSGRGLVPTEAGNALLAYCAADHRAQRRGRRFIGAISRPRCGSVCRRTSPRTCCRKSFCASPRNGR